MPTPGEIMPSPRVTVDADLCVGSGDCVRIAPSAFEVDEAEGIALVQPGAAQTPEAQLKDAAYQCPTGAIAVEDT
jgi:ferredoxin